MAYLYVPRWICITQRSADEGWQQFNIAWQSIFAIPAKGRASFATSWESRRKALLLCASSDVIDFKKERAEEKPKNLKASRYK